MTLAKICSLLNCKNVTCQKSSFAKFAKLQLPKCIFSENAKKDIAKIHDILNVQKCRCQNLHI